jgi:glycosyltransferase involved in cell wall biosynthesis
MSGETLIYVSVIVPTYGREEPLCTVIKELLEQDYGNYEIIVVDQTAGHTEATEAFLADLPERVRVIRRAEPNLPAARNEGMRAAEGDVILFVDDDARVSPAFVGRHASHYASEGTDAVAGAILDVEKRYAAMWPREADDPCLQYFKACWQYNRPREVTHAPGGNMSFRSEWMEKTGGFDEAYIGPGFREESDFFIRVVRAGGRVLYDPRCWLIHPQGFREGGCWQAFDGLPGWERYYNHAYFVLKNFKKRAWTRLFARAFRAQVLNRRSVLHPSLGIKALARFWRGWRTAWHSAPRKEYVP